MQHHDLFAKTKTNATAGFAGAEKWYEHLFN
jgi:hypothetical protein